MLLMVVVVVVLLLLVVVVVLLVLLLLLLVVVVLLLLVLVLLLLLLLLLLVLLLQILPPPLPLPILLPSQLQHNNRGLPSPPLPSPPLPSLGALLSCVVIYTFAKQRDSRLALVQMLLLACCSNALMIIATALKHSGAIGGQVCAGDGASVVAVGDGCAAGVWLGCWCCRRC
jgi:hypothetical protein